MNRVVAMLPRAARACLVLAVFIPPVIFNRGTADAFNLTKLTATWIFGLTAFALWLAWRVESGIKLPPIRIGLAVAAFLLAQALATVFSHAPVVSIIGLYQRYGGLVPYVLYAAILFTVVGLYWQRPKSLDQVIWAIAAASFLIAGYALLQAAGADWIPWKMANGAPPSSSISTMGNSNFAGGYLGMACPFVVYLLITHWRRRKWTLLIILAMQFAAISASGSRGGMLAAGAGLIAMAAVYRDRLPRSIRIPATALLALGLVAVLLIVRSAAVSAGKDQVLGYEILRTDTLDTRFYFWDGAVRIFKANPIIGTGPDTYLGSFPLYRSAKDANEHGLEIPDKAHNVYLEHASNAGILGITSFLALFGLALWFGYRRARTSGPDRLIAAAFVGALAGYLMQAVFSIDVPPIASFGWVVLGGLAVLADPAAIRHREQLPAPAPIFKRRGLIHGALALTLLAGLFVGTLPYRADRQFLAASRSSDFSDEPQNHYRRAIELNPLEPSYIFRYGGFLEQQATRGRARGKRTDQLETAAELRERAMDRHPGNMYYILGATRTYAAWAQTDRARFKDAERVWRQALARDPNDWVILQRYCDHLLSWSEAVDDQSVARRATQQIELLLKVRPGDANMLAGLGRNYLALEQPDRARVALETALKLEPDHRAAQELMKQVSGSG